MIEFKIIEAFTNDRRQVAVNDTDHPNFEARMAMALLEKWGMVAAEDDGEDSAGRHKIRLSTPDEVVARSIAVAEKATAAMRANGWIVTGPTWAEIDGAVIDRDK